MLNGEGVPVPKQEYYRICTLCFCETRGSIDRFHDQLGTRCQIMFMSKRAFYVGGSIALLVGFLLGTVLTDDDRREALKKLEDAFLVISERYVDELDAAELAESALRGMLEELDPHSVYIEAERMRRVEEDFSGGFEGIGISYEFVEGVGDKDTLTVLSVIPGGPSEEAGLMSGDRIVKVDGADIIGFVSADVQRTLKGPRGTQVALVVIRPGYQEVLEFTIVRDRIPLYSVDIAYMVDDKTGYIKVSRFARTTYREFLDALRNLKRQGMQRLMLDLRGNAGGYMEMAVRMADEFLADDALIVSQRGRGQDTNHDFVAHADGRFERNAVIVLVNRSSASASEIVSGALQDHDRGLIVGEQTFGKGLVQQQHELPDGSAIRVTISHFYTPSGRLIQTPYHDGDREDYHRMKEEMRHETALLSLEEIIERVPDSLKYSTAAGRTVIGGGGILPDYIVQPDSVSRYLRAILGKALTNTFARSWLDREGDALRATWGDDRQGFADRFVVSDEMFEEFLRFGEPFGVVVTEEGSGFTREEAEMDRAWVNAQIKGRLAVGLFGLDAYYPVWHKVDRIFKEAMKLWPEAERLTRITEDR